MGSTHIDDDVQRLVIGEENAHAPAVLHDSVVTEVQFVHRVGASLAVSAGLRVPGNAAASENATAKLRCSSHTL